MIVTQPGCRKSAIAKFSDNFVPRLIGVTYVYWIILLTFIERESFFLEEFRSDIWRLAQQRR